jgi:pimeloyl-ACP methyl ester carboxylesterase
MPYANNRGVKIYYETEGRGPPLVLMHGFASTLDSWRDTGYTQALGKSNRLILIDARGHGKSDKLHSAPAYTYRKIVGDIIAVLDSLKVEKAIYFGYSMGAIIGYGIPLFALRRFRALILGGAPYAGGNAAAGDEFLTFLQETLENAIKQAPPNPMEYYLTEMEKVFGETPPLLRATTLASDALALLSLVRAYRNTVNPVAEKALKKIIVPCLLYAGEADPWFPAVKWCAGAIPYARFFSLPALDHMQGLLKSELVLPHLMEFLREVNRRW